MLVDKIVAYLTIIRCELNELFKFQTTLERDQKSPAAGLGELTPVGNIQWRSFDSKGTYALAVYLSD